MTDRPGSEFGDGEPVVRDKRRIDPQSGRLRDPQAPGSGPIGSGPERAGAAGGANGGDVSEAGPTGAGSAGAGSGASSGTGSGSGTGRGNAGTGAGAGGSGAGSAGSGVSGAPGRSGPAGQPPKDPSDLIGPSAQEALLTEALAERTADLQRLQAEYVNYKRRVDREREAARDLVTGTVLTELLGILDDIGRAREAGELEGAFKAVAESLERVTEKLGLVRYGEVGDAFDPRIHEALLHNYSDQVAGPTATMVMQPGYRHGERILRPARVAVSEPTEPLPEPADGAVADSGSDNGSDDDKA